MPCFKLCVENFELWNVPGHKFKFQVYPPFTYSGRVQNIALEQTEVRAGTGAFVTGWGATTVSQYIKYCVEQQLTFYQNFSQRPPHIIKLSLRKVAHLEPIQLQSIRQW